MVEKLYSEYPELYDAIQSAWDYARDVSLICETVPEREGTRLLEVGCGTGEHTSRFVDAGFTVTAVDPNAGMLSRAREKTTADFRDGGLPDLPVNGSFDVIVAIRGVINHLPPSDLSDAVESLADHLADDGVLIFDNAPLPRDGNHPALDIGSTDTGEYARIVQMNPTGEGRLSWDSVVFTPDGSFFVDSYEMTAFEDSTIASRLSEAGLTVETLDGYGPGDDRTVFVSSPAGC